ncbi:MAG: helix-turn-helix domain-containing protein [Peptococcaceae bacterium]|nr:helix-turn-helix domain-containing protein [Peptococcaceae bacterium]
MPHRNNCAHERRNVIGKKLRSLRAAKGLSTQKLSEVLMELTGVYIDTSSLSRLEKGKRVVSDYELVALAQVFGISILDLYDEPVKNLCSHCRKPFPETAIISSVSGDVLCASCAAKEIINIAISHNSLTKDEAEEMIKTLTDFLDSDTP